MNRLFASGQPLATPLRRILLDLRDTRRSHIVLAVADNPVLRREAIAEVARRLSGKYALREFDFLHTDVLSLGRFCRTAAADEEQPVCVLAHGLDALKAHDAARYRTALELLNAHREDIRDTKTAVVLWLDAATNADVLEHAPDFADWRTASVTFDLPPDETVVETKLGALSVAEAERHRRQIRRFEEMLQRPNLSPALAAEYQKQIAHHRRELGEDAASRAALSRAARTAAESGNYKQLEDLYRRHVIDRFSKLTLYSVNSDAPLSVDLEHVFVKLNAIPARRGPAVFLLHDFGGTGKSQLALDFANAVLSARISEQSWATERLSVEIPPAAAKRSTETPHLTTADFSAGSYLREFLAYRAVDYDWKVVDQDSLPTFTPSGEEVSGTTSVENALRTYQVIAVVGAPGSGKTTLLKYLALTFARNQASKRLELNEKRLPIFVTLRDLSRFVGSAPKRVSPPDLLSAFLNEHFREVAPHLNLPDDFFRRALEGRRCLVLLDGLDEVADVEKRNQLTHVVAEFIAQFRGNRFIVTSRPRGYEGDARQRFGPLLAEYTIRDFDDEDMADFARRWYEAVTRDQKGNNPEADIEAKGKADDLLRAIHADARVRALAHNPLLLSVLAMVHQRGATLPQRRAELYDECTDLLLGYWDQTKGGAAKTDLTTYGGLTRSERRVLLEPIALWFHERGESGQEVRRDDLEQKLACEFREVLGDTEPRSRDRAARFLDLIVERAGLLVERETGVFAFAHLTFQEYLAARAIADRDAYQNDDDYIHYSLKRLHDPWWQEVLLLEVGHLSDVRHFGRRARSLTTKLLEAIRNAGSEMEDILKRDLLFAARALSDVGPIGVDEDVRRSIISDLITLWHTAPFGTQRRQVVEVFAYAMPTLDGQTIRAELLRCLLDEKTGYMAARAFEQLGEAAASPEVVTELTQRALSKSERQSLIAARALAAMKRLNPRIVHCLVELTQHPSIMISDEAFRVLAAGETAATPK